MRKRIFSLIMCAVLVLSLLPAQAIALETEECTETIQETDPLMEEEPILEVTEATEETEAVEEETEPTEETVSEEEETEPAEEVTEPVEEDTTLTEETVAPTEEETAPTEELPELEQIQQEPMLADSSVVASGTCGENVTWTLNETGTLTITGNGAMGKYTYLADTPWYAYREQVKNVIIGSGVTSIYFSAIYKICSLDSIVVDPDNLNYSSDINGVLFNKDKTELIRAPGGISGDYIIPESVTTISNSAFMDCSSLEYITIPDSVTYIGSGVFYNCSSLISVTLPRHITQISTQMFYGCTSLTSFTVSYRITEIGQQAFAGCSSLTGIWVDENNSTYASDERGVLFNKNRTELIQAPGGITGNYIVPGGVTRIADYAFRNCNGIQNISFPDSITVIGFSAFYNCDGITSIELPDSITLIDENAFNDCSNLTSITLPGGITSIFPHVFSSCTSLSSIELPENITEICYAAFWGCTGLTSITLPDKIDDICDFAFSGCTSLCEITFTGDAPEFSYDPYDFNPGSTPLHTFNDVKATAYYPANNSTWTEEVMQNYGGTITWIPYSNEIIASGTCSENLTWTLDGAGTLSIAGNGAMGSFLYLADMPWYDYREQIKAVHVKSGVTSINISAISKASSLNAIWVDTDNSYYSSDTYGVLFNKDRTELIKAPNEISGEYSIPDSVTTVGYAAFMDCRDLEYVAIPDSVTYIGSGVFYNCSSLTSVTLPRRITQISTQMFCGCTSLTSITIPYRVTQINQGAFNGCSSLTSLTIPARVSSIDSGAFNNCTSLTGIWVDENNSTYSNDANGVLFNIDKTILIQAPTGISGSYTVPESVIRIEDFAFNGCKKLSNIIIPDSVNELGMHAFSGCSKLTSIAIPDGVTYLDWGIFASCTNLSSVTLPANLTAIGDYALQYCSSLTSIELPDTLNQIGYAAFLECTSLTSITLPKSITYIGDFAFGRCSGLGEIIFEGNAPEFQIDHGPEVTESQAFSRITANAYYPINNSTWTADVMKNYYGTITWIPYSEVENRLILDSEALSGYDSVWIDGTEMSIQKDGDSWYIDLPDGNARVMTTYEYVTDGTSEDGVAEHVRYPISMRVWTLENRDGAYMATHQTAFDDILQYSGVAIRVTGKKGIRMITSIDADKKESLVGDGLAGYTLQEYGTAVAWASQISANKPLVLGKSYVSSNYAYKKNVADPVFRQANGLMQYTNVLVNFSNEQCVDDLAMRPYMILADASGNEITIYGGIVSRSIGYIALRNRKAFMNDTDPYDYLWDIIHYVYGDAYDADWQPSWTDTIL